MNFNCLVLMAGVLFVLVDHAFIGLGLLVFSCYVHLNVKEEPKGKGKRK